MVAAVGVRHYIFQKGALAESEPNQYRVPSHMFREKIYMARQRCRSKVGMGRLWTSNYAFRMATAVFDLIFLNVQ